MIMFIVMGNVCIK